VASNFQYYLEQLWFSVSVIVLSCEERNAFLDRGMIVGTFENKSLGFWNDID